MTPHSGPCRWEKVGEDFRCVDCGRIYDDGTRGREEGMAKVQTPIVTAAWLPAAREALKHVARTHRMLTSEDVWAALDDAGIGKPSDNRAMGPVMRWGEHEGWVERTDQFIRANRGSRHRAPIQLYRSRAYEAHE